MRELRWLAAAVATATLVAAPTVAQSVAHTSSAQVEREIARVARMPAGKVGVVATDLDSGATLSVNADQRFPMASAVKVAIAAAWLDGVDRGAWSLTTMYPLDEGMRVRSDGITDTLPHPGVALSGANLVELSLTVSDNTATDMLLKAVGGPAAVTRWLAAKGVAGQRVDRSIARLLIDVSGHKPDPALADGPALGTFMPVEPWKSDDEKWPVNAAFDADPRDSTTPAAMAQLLVGLHKGGWLEPATTRFLWDVLARCKTGGKRVKALLPAGTPWAHKTGTLPGISNDVGVMTLPNGHRVALAVLSYGEADPAKRDARIAEIGRIVFDGLALQK
ncbi:class A beta-lactamase [Sphingomonas donggukensis]|uniref:beta-lactamase n=1 Tax=Sphingomonas donggukensis TaxID=2949093 RepID=A0ABY4TTD1_9SPHN|nr:class A beta-lactamase [Sphingomonas donggukensis]URW75665.1 class A beta-lactamase [Sphingomonas donggukensis]